MAKVIDRGLAGPDDPIYKGGLRVSSLPVLNESADDTDGTDPMQPAVDQIERALRAKVLRDQAMYEEEIATKKSSESAIQKPRGDK